MLTFNRELSQQDCAQMAIGIQSRDLTPMQHVCSQIEDLDLKNRVEIMLTGELVDTRLRDLRDRCCVLLNGFTVRTEWGETYLESAEVGSVKNLALLAGELSLLDDDLKEFVRYTALEFFCPVLNAKCRKLRGTIIEGCGYVISTEAYLRWRKAAEQERHGIEQCPNCRDEITPLYSFESPDDVVMVDQVDVGVLEQKRLEKKFLSATQKGNLPDIGQYLQDGGNVNAVNGFGYTALILACKEGRDEVVSFLLNVPGINLDAKNRRGDTALIYASRKGFLGIVIKLLDKGASPDLNNGLGDRALLWAARNGYEDIVIALLHKGVDVNAANHKGETALMWAASKGFRKIVDILKAVDGVKIDQKNHKGETALDLAEKRGFPRIFEKVEMI